MIVITERIPKFITPKYQSYQELNAAIGNSCQLLVFKHLDNLKLSAMVDTQVWCRWLGIHAILTSLCQFYNDVTFDRIPDIHYLELWVVVICTSLSIYRSSFYDGGVRQLLMQKGWRQAPDYVTVADPNLPVLRWKLARIIKRAFEECEMTLNILVNHDDWLKQTIFDRQAVQCRLVQTNRFWPDA